MLGEISNKRLHARAAEQFVQGLAHQAVFLDSGMMAREEGYHGFGTVPLLSVSLFSEPFIVDRYDPLRFSMTSDAVTSAVLKRFNSAAERCYLTLIENGNTDRARVAFSIHHFYESAFFRIWKIQQAENSDHQFEHEVHRAVEFLQLSSQTSCLIPYPPRHAGLVCDRSYRSSL